MAGNGPAPKDPSRRARRNADPVALRVITAPPVSQPELPTLRIERDGELVEMAWPSITEEWWTMWRDSPLSANFIAADWFFLLDTARLHAQLWSGDSKVASELRLRVAKYGQTPEDRARLRITFAQADEADEKRVARPSARSRYQGPQAVDG